MLLAFELSGEHSTIPASEVIACLESQHADFKIHLSLDGCLVIDLINNEGNIIEVLSKRLSMTHHIIGVLGSGGAGEEDILFLVNSSLVDFEGTYSIRVRRIREYSRINTAQMENKLGEIFYKRGAHANLKKPQMQFRVLLTEDKSIFGCIARSIDRSAYEARKPHYKPFFYPGVLMPRLARALVNIAKPEGYLFDPFCGTGGILIEAGLLGVKVIGSDVQRKLLLGAKMNLDYYNVDYSLMYQDASRLALRDKSVDSVVTDPPYGRSAKIKAESIEHLLADSLKEIFRVLKKGKRAVFVSERPIEDWAIEAGFNVVESHLQRVHKSLTRRISVLEKC
ncbi:MAG: methyltransferase domain-containing protein [Euryarchaeota archaeon]|nr:methyltransferase domain-containing protein [Euryarchaeota archaeon]MBU4490968.1 methyltransferase domain-containing protein [Euryarchaeota archaeon]